MTGMVKLALILTSCCSSKVACSKGSRILQIPVAVFSHKVKVYTWYQKIFNLELLELTWACGVGSSIWWDLQPVNIVCLITFHLLHLPQIFVQKTQCWKLLQLYFWGLGNNHKAHLSQLTGEYVHVNENAWGKFRHIT